MHLEGEWRTAEREGRAKQEVRDWELQSHAVSCKDRQGTAGLEGSGTLSPATAGHPGALRASLPRWLWPR